MDPTEFHQPVLLAEVLQFLGNSRRVFDGTLGAGGHTEALLAGGASVVATDRDPVAREVAGARLQAYVEAGRLRIVASTFADAAESSIAVGPMPGAADGGLAGWGAERFDGILLDLGVSSHQFDDQARGFTFREGAPLDMRMGEQGPGAADWLNESSETALATAFREFGDEPKARALARSVVHRRRSRPFMTSDDLVGAIRATLGPRSGPPDFARIFQAVRIAVNDEVGELERALPALRDRLGAGGTMVVISYHSGEDRAVKNAFRDWSVACTCPPLQPRCICGGEPLGKVLTRKPVEAGEAEVARNPRARSARLRAWQRLR